MGANQSERRAPTDDRQGQVIREGLLPLPRAPDEKTLPALARFEHFHFALLDSLKPDKHGIKSMTSSTIYRRSKLNLFLDDGRVLEAQSLNQIWIQYRPSLSLSPSFSAAIYRVRECEVGRCDRF